MPKRDLVGSLIDDTNSDLLAFTETWLHPDVNDNEIIPDNNSYNIYRNDRVDRRGGGVLLAVKKTLTSYLINSNSALEIVWVVIAVNSIKILTGVCYRPPDSCSTFVSELQDSIIKATQLSNTNTIYLLGDFNFPLIDWNHLSSSCRISEKFISLTLDFNLTQVITQPTRGPNVLDLILTTAPESLHTLSHIEGFSDHQLLQASIKLPVPFSGVETKIIRDYKNADYTKINEELDMFFNTILLPSFYSRTIQDNWLKFKNIMSTLINQYVPLISISNDRSNPWFTRTLTK